MSGAGQPKVTILMASHNRLALLKESVASAVAQDYPDFEVLIVDDGSDDLTRKWLEGAAKRHSRLRVVLQQHAGVGEARARGIREARGEWICVLDSDDLLVPQGLSRLARELGSDPRPALVHCSLLQLLPGGRTRVRRYRNFRTPRGMVWATLLSPQVPFKHSGTLFRRSVAVELGSYNPNLPCKIDIDLYLKFLTAGYLPRLVPEPLVQFRVHEDSVSRDRVLGIRVWIRLIDRYGPVNGITRLGVKAVRVMAETLKLGYMTLVSVKNPPRSHT